MFAKIKKIIKRKPENKENKTPVTKYYDMEEVTVTGFCNFCKNNIPLVITVSITLFFTYGIKLFGFGIVGIDAELFMADKSGFRKNWIAVLRFGGALINKLWYINEYNPFTAFFTTFCLIWFFTISWCYIIAVFSRDTARNNKLVPFALVFMTMPVWAEQFNSSFQAVENALIISLCPYVIYLFFKGFLDSEKRKIISAFILLAFMPSVYQAIVPMYCCGVFICFVLLSEYSEYEPRIYSSLCSKLFITLLGSLIAYLFIARIITVVFNIKLSEYYDNTYFKWGKRTIRDNIIGILGLGYALTVGHIPLFQSIVNPIIDNLARVNSMALEKFGHITNISRVYGNVLLLPSVIFFLVKITSVMRRMIPSGRRLLYMLAGVGIPLCIFILTVVNGAMVSMWTLYTLPLAFAFILFYLIRTYKKRVAAIITCMSILIAVHQAQISAQLFYSDQIRYNEDVRLTYELNDLITQIQTEKKQLPVVLVGKYQIASRFQTNFMQGEIIGHSIYEWTSSLDHTTIRGIAFMKTLGINYDMPDENQIKRAIKEAASMPSYPNPGCVKRVQDYIVVKLSENIYEDVL